jgi:hypothetical protein
MRRNLIIAAVALVVFAGAYAFITVAKPFDKKPAKSGEAAQAALPAILDAGSKKLKSVTITPATGAGFTIEKTGEAYRVAGNPGFELDKDKAETLFFAFTGMAPKEVIDAHPKAVGDFGLDKPRTAEALLEDGTKLRLEIGSKTPGGDWYVRTANSETVYSLDSYQGDNLAAALADYRQKNYPTVDPQKITALTIKSEGRTIRIVNRPEPIDPTAMTTLTLESPFRKPYPVDSDAFTAIAKEIPTSLAVQSFIDAPGSLSTYGLDSPKAEAEVKDETADFHILVGKEAGPDSVYAKFPDKKTVFKVAKSDVAFIKDALPFKLLSKLGMLVNIDKVEDLQFTVGVDSFDLRLKRTPTTTKKADGTMEENVDYSVNGKKVEEKAFKSIYQAIIGIAFEGEIGKPFSVAGKKPEATVLFTLKGGAGEVRFSFYSANADFYAFSGGTDPEFLVTKSQVSDAVSAIKKTLT